MHHSKRKNMDHQSHRIRTWKFLLCLHYPFVWPIAWAIACRYQNTDRRRLLRDSSRKKGPEAFLECSLHCFYSRIWSRSCKTSEPWEDRWLPLCCFKADILQGCHFFFEKYMKRNSPPPKKDLHAYCSEPYDFTHH